MKLSRFYCIMSMDSLFVGQLMHLVLVDSLSGNCTTFITPTTENNRSVSVVYS